MNNIERSGTFGDFVQPFQIEGPGLRGRLVRLGAAVDAVVGRHGYPAPVAEMLAEAMAMGAVLASGLKYDGIFTLQMQGNGPVGLMIVDITSDGDMRGCARFDPERLNAAGSRAGGSVPRLLGAGHMAFTVDQGPEDWRRAVILMSSATPAELLEPGLSPNQILYRLFHEDGVRVFRRRPLRHHCRCTRAKVERILRSFPAAEIREMAEDGRITVTCEFCKRA
jgi:redox-regulated HSP33 family molecular chaperone